MFKSLSKAIPGFMTIVLSEPDSTLTLKKVLFESCAIPNDFVRYFTNTLYPSFSIPSLNLFNSLTSKKRFGLKFKFAIYLFIIRYL